MSEETKAAAEETVAEPETDQAPENQAAPESPHKGFFGKMDNYFGITKSGSNYRTEVVAGLTTFMAMVYILIVNAGMFSDVDPTTGLSITGISYGAAYIATSIGAIVGTLLMALLAKMPLALASGMGVNAYIVYTIIAGSGLTYANAMVFTLLDGVIFVVLTATGLRQKIFGAIPKAVRYAIPVGIGLFIAFIGFQDAEFIVADSSTLTTMVSFNILSSDVTFGGIIAPLVAILGVIAIAIMSHKKVKGAVLWGILGTAVLYYALHGIGYAVGDEASVAVFQSITWSNPISAFADWGTESVGQVFVNGFNFSEYLGIEGNSVGTLIVLLITSALSLCMIDMFDTIGTLYGACSKGNLLDENGTPINMNKMMMSDAIATCAGAVVGTSTVTTFVESSSGVAAGGKTGFTALVVALCFVVAMFLSPIAQLIPSSATATALIWVGVLMMSSVSKIDWDDAVSAIVAFLTFIVMLLGYSIAKGIGAGILAYIIIKVCTGKVKEIHVATWVIGVFFLAMFLLT